MNNPINCAPRASNEPFECPECEGEFVMHDNDKMCKDCGLLVGVDSGEDPSEWAEWEEHRRENYDGFYGEDRVKMVGGFAGVWFYTDNELF
jgi:predicted amidophosphoribosyltransferase